MPNTIFGSKCYLVVKLSSLCSRLISHNGYCILLQLSDLVMFVSSYVTIFRTALEISPIELFKDSSFVTQDKVMQTDVKCSFLDNE